MADQEQRRDPNEGEGNRTADRAYREGVKQTLEKGRVLEDAERAERDVERNPEEYQRAEQQARSHSAGEAPGDLDDANDDKV